jgi:prepilin-type N-terminal cleavage/methylation domain-containing protein
MRHQRGFTLFETVLVIALLGLVSAGLMAMQPQVFKVQNNGRDQVIGIGLLNACAERLLAKRRQSGLAAVTSDLCNGMGAGSPGFQSDPTVILKDAGNASVTTCSSASCTATITATKATAPAASLSAITLQLFAY